MARTSRVSVSIFAYGGTSCRRSLFGPRNCRLSDYFHTVPTQIKIRLTKYENAYLFNLTSSTFVHILDGSMLPQMT